jgi:predicted ferric reductase
MRSNFLLHALGLSFERSLFYHKALATAFLVVGVIHGVGEGFNVTGVAMVVLGGVSGLAYFLLAPYNYEYFHLLHISLYLALIPLAFLHGASFLGYSIIIWGIDVSIRSFITRRKVSATFTMAGDSVVKVSFPKSFAYMPGQYCFLMVKEINMLEYHPFSLCSAPHEDTVSFHCKAVGDWTNKLKDLALKSGISVTHDVYVEGPYGNVTVDVESEVYKVVVLVAGGIGITPMLSMWSQLMKEQKEKGAKKVNQCYTI